MTTEKGFGPQGQQQSDKDKLVEIYKIDINMLRGIEGGVAAYIAREFRPGERAAHERPRQGGIKYLANSSYSWDDSALICVCVDLGKLLGMPDPGPLMYYAAPRPTAATSGSLSFETVLNLIGDVCVGNAAETVLAHLCSGTMPDSIVLNDLDNQ